jgi:hypothetical protein
MDIDLDLNYLMNVLPGFEYKEPLLREFLNKLIRCGAVYDRSTRDRLSYSYTSDLMRYCTLKAGNILETKVLMEAQTLLQDGALFFQDCRMGVTIDWDGVIHAPMEHLPETRNEIDVIAMRGVTPLFISCKNGNIGEEELYKLHTVATRFGGTNARKMLIASDLDQKSSSGNHAFIQRAWDMNIILMTDAASLTKEGWRDLFKIAMQ